MPELRGGRPALDGQVRGLRRVEHHRRGSHRQRRCRARAWPSPPRDAPSRCACCPTPTATRSMRMPTGLAELDRVTGGGIVPGSALLIGGEPGIGKSTLLLQVAAAFAAAGRRAVYFTGEEATAQVRLRAERLGLAQAPLALASETELVQHPGDAGRGQARRPRRDRFDPDAVGRRARGGTRHREPGARCHPGADPLCQGARARRCCSSATSPRTGRSPARR